CAMIFCMTERGASLALTKTKRRPRVCHSALKATFAWFGVPVGKNLTEAVKTLTAALSRP
ncbi:hypothetical protein, partial [Rhodoferax sp. UBA5149]|uniref:hypothetical protein n=1 Tax=Rhodoferax sp. UBA5149 TaxID=1947379 RepID=UPI0025FFA9B4